MAGGTCSDKKIFTANPLCICNTLCCWLVYFFTGRRFIYRRGQSQQRTEHHTVQSLSTHTQPVVTTHHTLTKHLKRTNHSPLSPNFLNVMHSLIFHNPNIPWQKSPPVSLNVLVHTKSIEQQSKAVAPPSQRLASDLILPSLPPARRNLVTWFLPPRETPSAPSPLRMLLSTCTFHH